MNTMLCDDARKTRMVVFGDSYSAGAVDGNGNSDGPTMIEEKRWWRYVADAFGFDLSDVACYARNGAGWCGMEVGNTFASQLDEARGGDDVSVVLLAGGRNDGHPGSQSGDVFALCRQWLDAAARKFPKAHLYAIPFLWDCGMWSMTEQQRTSRQAMLDALESWPCPRRLTILSHAWRWGWGRRDCYGVYLHPNEEGHRLLGAHAVASLRGCALDVNREWSVPVREPWCAGQSVFRFREGNVFWELSLRLSREIVVAPGAVAGSCPVAAPEWLDLPQAWGDAVAIDPHGDVSHADLVGIIDAQSDVTGDPNANPRKSRTAVRLINRGVSDLRLPSGTRLHFRTHAVPVD